MESDSDTDVDLVADPISQDINTSEVDSNRKVLYKRLLKWFQARASTKLLASAIQSYNEEHQVLVAEDFVVDCITKRCGDMPVLILKWVILSTSYPHVYKTALIQNVEPFLVQVGMHDSSMEHATAAIQNLRQDKRMLAIFKEKLWRSAKRRLAMLRDLLFPDPATPEGSSQSSSVQDRSAPADEAGSNRTNSNSSSSGATSHSSVLVPQVHDVNLWQDLFDLGTNVAELSSGNRVYLSLPISMLNKINELTVDELKTEREEVLRALESDEEDPRDPYAVAALDPSNSDSPRGEGRDNDSSIQVTPVQDRSRKRIMAPIDRVPCKAPRAALTDPQGEGYVAHDIVTATPESAQPSRYNLRARHPQQTLKN